MSNVYETDVLIVGGGPAGSSTALSLLKYAHLKVVIIEQGDFNTLRVGEQVNASIFELLAYLGISKNDLDQKSFLPGYDSLAAWGSTHLASRHSVFSTQIDSYQLDREHFDLFLLEKASESGAIVLPRTKALEFTQDEHCWTIKLKHEIKGELLIKAKYLVDASGRQSYVCRKLGIECNKFDDLVAVGSFLHFKNNKPIEQEIVLETVEQGWWYFAALPNQQVVVSLFTDATIVKEQQLQKVDNWSAMLSKTKHIRRKIENAVANDKLWIRNAFSHLSTTSDKPYFVAVGDAAASFDPISSLGIGFAISSACHAAKAIIDHKDNDTSLLEYKKGVENIFNNYLETKHIFYKKEQRWNDSHFWKKRNVL